MLIPATVAACPPSVVIGSVPLVLPKCTENLPKSSLVDSFLAILLDVEATEKYISITFSPFMPLKFDAILYKFVIQWLGELIQ